MVSARAAERKMPGFRIICLHAPNRGCDASDPQKSGENPALREGKARVPPAAGRQALVSAPPVERKMPGFRTQIVGTPTNRGKARRYTIRLGTRALGRALGSRG